MFTILSLFSLFGVSLSTGGVDVSQRTYVNNWSCMVSNGKSFAIVRVYQSNGVPDANGMKYKYYLLFSSSFPLFTSKFLLFFSSLPSKSFYSSLSFFPDFLSFSFLIFFFLSPSYFSFLTLSLIVLLIRTIQY